MIQLAPVTVVRPLVVFAAAILRSIGVPALSQPAPPAPAARDVVAAVRAPIDGVRARQAALPPPKDDAERLTRLGELDWAPRDVIMGFDFSLISPAERQGEVDAASALIGAVDRQDQAALLKLARPMAGSCGASMGKRRLRPRSTLCSTPTWRCSCTSYRS